MQDKYVPYLDVFLNVEDKLMLSKVGLHDLSRCPHSNSRIQRSLQVAERDTYIMKTKLLVLKLGWCVPYASMAFDNLTHVNKKQK
jgi:hypothetical protein